ncbi:hypothetical protein QTG54_011831 [Skeletonema marinoi]|uniref:UVR domain-containing protein n=1 Tax=Skeletonema marinoi TaxID=267567 RepID=A0AAD8Y1Y0_9STRA|nr:hypothetical protein QTG54_011831 [Skeletonema marinoi]
MKHIITISIIFLGTLCLRSSAFARMPKPFLCMRATFKLDDKVSSNAAGDDSLFDSEDAAAIDAHDLSDSGLEAAAMERAVMLAEEYKEQQLKKKEMDRRNEPCVGGAALINSLEEQHAEVRKTAFTDDDESLLEAEDAAAIDAHDLSDSGLEAAAMERAVMLAEEYKEEQIKKNNKERTDRIKSIEEHYKQINKDIEAIERLIKEADDADHASGHLLERTFSDNDAADLALMMMEKSVVAATDRLEMRLEKVKQTEQEVRTALEKKYTSKALAESIERERHAAEMRFLSNKYRNDDVSFSAVHDNDKVLHDAHRQEHDAELRLEKAIEEDIATKKDLEQMIENKAALKEVLHELQEIIHEHAALAMEKENARKSPKS